MSATKIEMRMKECLEIDLIMIILFQTLIVSSVCHATGPYPDFYLLFPSLVTFMGLDKAFHFADKISS